MDGDTAIIDQPPSDLPPAPDAPDSPARDEPGETEILHSEIALLTDLNRELVDRFRAALLASDPAIEPELVVGETAAEVEASFEAARRLVAGIRESVRREQTASVPAGSPGRTTSGPRTAYEKIRSGLARMQA